MNFGKSKLELKVGIFIFIGIIILVLFVLFIGDFKTWTSKYEVCFVFGFANGIKIGAPVRFAGIDVGEVNDIKFIFSPEEQKTRVKIICWIKKDVRIPSDSTVWVNTLGLLGEKYIEIMPGRDYSKCVANKGILIGIDPIPMQEITQLAKDIVTDLDDAIIRIKNKEGTIGKLLYDNTLYNDIDALIKDLRAHPWKLFFRPPKEKTR